MKQGIIYIILIFLISNIGYSQIEVDSIENIEVDSMDIDQLKFSVIGKNTGHSIKLRWAPSRIDGWITGVNSGYRIDRLKVDSNYLAIGEWDTLITPIIHPLSIEEVKNRLKIIDDDYLRAAAESLYGYQLEYGTKPPKGDIIGKAISYMDSYVIALLSADFSFEAATALGWGYEDKNIDVNATYFYRVYANARDSISMILDDYTFVNPNQKISPIIENLIEKEGQVDIMMPRLLNDESFTGYIVERAEEKTSSWERLNNLPYTQPLTDQEDIGNKDYIVYRDTGLVNYKPYKYRVLGLDPFGDVSEPSKTYIGMGVDKTPPLPPEKFKVEMEKGKGMQLTWEYKSPPKDLKGFIIGKSRRPYDPTTKLHDDLLPADTRTFFDEVPDQMSDNYYRLFVIDENDNVSYTNSVYGSYIDSIPPTKPKIKGYEIDSSGYVTISWEVNKEIDLLGYHVFFSNKKSEFYTNISGDVVQDSIFRDTIEVKSLNEKAYYRITALDINYNVSEISDWLEVVKPDIVAPSSPIIVSHRATDQGIELEVKKSQSRDVTHYELYRKHKNESWKKIRDYKDSEVRSIILDEDDLKPGNLYIYKVYAVDDAGLKSKETYDYTARSKMSVLEGKLTDVEFKLIDKSVNISWQYQGRKNDIINIYRAYPNENFKLIKSYDAGHLLGKDFVIKKEKTYEYRLQLKSKKGEILDTSEIYTIVSGE